MSTPRAAFRLAVVSLLFSAPFVLPACSKGSGTSEKDRAGAAVIVNGHAIKETEVSQVVQLMQQQNPPFVPPDSTTTGATPEEKQRNFAIQRLIERALLLDDINKQKITLDSAEVEMTWRQYRSRFGPQDSLGAPEKEAEMRKSLTEDLKINKFIESKIADTLKVTDAEMQAFYDGHPAEFAGREQVHARHILFRVDPAATDMQKAEARRKAEGVLAQAKQGADFAELAKKNSEDTGSGANGGDLGYFAHGQMVAPFDSAAFALAPGQISGLVESSFGYHIIKVEDKKAAESVKLDAIKPQLEQYLKQAKIQKTVQAYVDKLKAAAKIEHITKKG